MPNDETGRQRTKLDAVKRISTVVDKQKQNIFYQFLKDIKNSFRLFIARYIQRKKQERREKERREELIKETVLGYLLLATFSEKNKRGEKN